MKPIDIIKLIIRVLLGGLFIATAILKLLSVEEFELYIYSFNLFNFITVVLLSRLLIAFELLLGIFLIMKIKYRYTWWLTLFTMVGFTLFLVYVAKFRNDNNCHCFGALVELNPVHSICKNILTIIMLLFVRSEENYRFRFKKLVIGTLIAAGVIVPFVANPMDALYNMFYSEEKQINLTVFEELKQDTTLTNFNIDQGNYILTFYMSGCKYCKLGMKKLQSIVEKNEIDENRIKVMISGSEEGIEGFKTITKTENYNFYSLSLITSINLIYGIYPTFVFVEDGKVKKVVDFRGIDEKEVVEFLK